MSGDSLDRAQDETDFLTGAAIRNIRNNIQRGLKPMGQCYYCDSPIGSSLLFCNADCRQDFEHEEKVKRIAGR